MRRRWRAAVAAGMFLVAGACGGGGGPERTSAPAPRTLPRDLVVEERTEPLVDASRTTEGFESVAPSDTRALPTRVFHPAPGQPGRPYPLLLFAHGSGGLGTGYDTLLRTWAAAGYVVAAPAFPVAREDGAAGDWTVDLPKVPGDVSFVIDEVLRLNTDGTSPLQGAVDPQRIGVAGHSMGGMITLAVAGNTCCHDARIKAAVVLAGRETPFGAGQFWARIITPILLVHGDDDHNVVYADGKRAFANAPPPRFLLTVLGGDHGTPYTGDPSHPQAGLVTEATLDFLDHFLHGDPDGLDRLQGRASAPGVARLEHER
ncbi:MAG TPA: dienelactone hydrolase family protein [Acidimicrobiales bacterium]|nr:dienelactone hydrolase family protein [Acidimicrobiales bacterium]